jgi:hypothetical protein
MEAAVRVLIRSVVGLSFLISLSVPGFGQRTQTLRDRDPDLTASKKLAADLQDATFHRGPFYFHTSFRVADAGYTETGYVPTGEQAGGLTLTVEAPQRMYYVPHKKVILSAEVVPGYSFIQEGNDGNQFNFLLRGDAHFLFNHLYLDVYALTADQIRAHVADINRLVTARDKEIGAVGEIKYSSRTSALFSVNAVDISYPTDRFQPIDLGQGLIPVQILDRTEQNGRLSFLHKTLPRTSFFVAGELSQYDFLNRQVADSRRTYLALGAAYDAGRTQVRIEAGPTQLDFEAEGEVDYEGINGRFSATRGNGRWVYSLTANRDLGFSVFVNNNYFVSNIGTVRVDYASTRKLSLNAASTYERDDYETTVLGQERTDTISFTSVGFTYALRRINVGADVGWYDRSSTAFGEEDSGIRYALRLSLNL